MVYGIVGGTPQYLLQMNDQLSVEDNIKNTFLNPTSSLFEEPENHSIIVRGADDLAYRRIEPYLSDYMGKVFEDICTQYLWKLLLKGKSSVEFAELGRWWGTDPVEKKQTEIDIIGEQDKNTALFGECKWTNEKVDLGILETLVKRSRLFHYENVKLYLFAKSGFTKGCIDMANELGNVELVSYKDILEEMSI